MRTPHTSHTLAAFPIQSCSFLSADELVLGGGGGSSRTGIKNKIRVYKITADRNIDLIDELELAPGEDTPTSMAADPKLKNIVCGVNSTEEKKKQGLNENCRVFALEDSKIVLKGFQNTLGNDGDLDDFQRVTVISEDGKFVAVAGTHDFSLLQYPSLTPASSSIPSKTEYWDASFTASTLLVTTATNLFIYNIPTSVPSVPSKEGKTSSPKALESVRTVNIPSSFGATASSTFRSAKYHPTNPKIAYTVIVVTPQRSKKTKTPSRQSFVCKWNAEQWTVISLKKIGDIGITCFDISPNGKLLAYSASNLTVGILDAHSLTPLVTILKAHEFAPTALRFNPTSSLLVSGGMDNSVRIIAIPEALGTSSSKTYFAILIAVIAILLAMLAQFLAQ